MKNHVLLLAILNTFTYIEKLMQVFPLKAFVLENNCVILQCQ